MLFLKQPIKNNAWNGSLNNQGNVLDEGVYLWQVITYDVNGKTIPARR
jgi:hypothetical protein